MAIDLLGWHNLTERARERETQNTSPCRTMPRLLYCLYSFVYYDHRCGLHVPTKVVNVPQFLSVVLLNSVGYYPGAILRDPQSRHRDDKDIWISPLCTLQPPPCPPPPTGEVTVHGWMGRDEYQRLATCWSHDAIQGVVPSNDEPNKNFRPAIDRQSMQRYDMLIYACNLSSNAFFVPQMMLVYLGVSKPTKSVHDVQWETDCQFALHVIICINIYIPSKSKDYLLL